MKQLIWYEDPQLDAKVMVARWVCRTAELAEPLKYNLDFTSDLLSTNVKIVETNIDFKYHVSYSFIFDHGADYAAREFYLGFKEYLASIKHVCQPCMDFVRKQLDDALNPPAYSWGGQQLANGGIISAYTNKSISFIADDYAATEMSVKSRQLPGMNYRVEKCPAEAENPLRSCRPTNIWGTVQHLNDKHKWTREAIAEWLENIHDPTGENGPNLAFQIKEEA